MRRVGVNFINILRTNVSYERRFGSFFYVQVTREKLPKQCLYEKFVRKMLMKLTIGWPSNYKLHTGKCLQASAQVNRVGYEVMLNISLQQMQKKKLLPFCIHFSTHLVRNNFGENCFSDFCGKRPENVFT